MDGNTENAENQFYDEGNQGENLGVAEEWHGLGSDSSGNDKLKGWREVKVVEN